MGEEKDKLTEVIIGCAFKICNTLGCGFLGEDNLTTDKHR